MLNQKTLKTVIKETRLLEAKELSRAVAEAQKKHLPLQDYLVSAGLVDEETLFRAIANFLKVPFINLKGYNIKKNWFSLIPSALAFSRQIVAFAKEGTELKVAMLDPLDLQTIEFVSRKTGFPIKAYLTTPSSLKDVFKNYHSTLTSELTVIKTGSAEENAAQLKKIAEDLPIINIVGSILEHAVFEEASDIHIEPMEKEVTVRYRVDGVLRPVMTLPKQVQAGITARVKILANLKIDEHMLPQDGRIKLAIGDEKFSLRVSILPVYDGEKIVMRLLREDTKPLNLEELGFLPEDKQKIEKNIAAPHGIILVTGPTGCGKTTTLYSILNILNQPGVNISTIEDPIEYHIPGVNQSQVSPRVGYTFATGLRAFLRQDPDIIMVGEIRDAETAEIAIHAAMTGHLVLSTLHTNDAPTAVPRLLDMGVPSFLVAFTANIIIAQRLVRKICPECRQPFKLTAANIADLEKMLDSAKMIELFKKNNCLKKEELKLNNWQFFRGEGCRKCRNEGYKGRLGIYEILTVDKEMAGMINRKATAEEIRKTAVNRGFVSMLEDGLVKAKKGLTTLEEVLEAAKE
ncbi:MAG: type II/IV secretion system protein [Candidatus Magasanikbacteria bacterium]|nr:type II/IV secretion system protein [Candidatus Magasanikbacteria bacterium]